MRNIVLVGFMGTGKTVVAKELSNRLKDMDYVSLDEMIEKDQNTSISQIFKEKGEPYFRKIEKEMVKKVSALKKRIIDAGGGVVLDKENVENLKRNGVMICLSATVNVILERTCGYAHRPLLNVEDPKKKIEDLLKLRAPFYARADYTIDTSNLSVTQVAEKIIKLLYKI